VERTCSKCGVRKPETEEFFRRRGTKDRGGLRPDCRDCSADRDRDYYLRNRDRERRNRADYRARTREQAKLRDAAYARTPEGKEARARAVSKWARTERGLARNRDASHRRRVAFRGGISDLTDHDWAESLAAFGGCCAYCGAAGFMTVDHVVPISAGGHHTRLNVVPACKSCNSSKFHHELASWFSTQPFFDPARLARIRDYLRGLHGEVAGADQRH
jgi:5-methylcytosine-specific restriction endonuclease McrA